MSAATERLTRLWEDPPSLWGWLTTVDRKRIGRRYLVTAMLFLLAGGVEAVQIRLQLARPEQRLLTPEAYEQIFSMHGITMIF
jgi:cytochrome c oxidase subunit 1/cytochrome c oxidase subunit I+III